MRRIVEDITLRNIEVLEESDVSEGSERPQETQNKPEDPLSKASDVRERFTTDSLKTADPITLLLMCYDIAKNSLRKAIEGIKTRNYELKYEGISKAMRVFDLLMATTEPNDIGKQLISSYLFITQKIVDADIKKDINALEKVIEYIQELETAWKKVKNKPKE